MKNMWFSLYTLVLALWVGGMAIFTFITTPVIFKSFGRDTAGDIVGKLFHGYFLYVLILSALALILFFLISGNRAAPAARLSLVLLIVALAINTYVTFKLHPDTESIKQRITSFEREAKDTPARKAFSRIHAVSAVLNLMVLIDGIVLIIAAPALRK
jgi:Domain of unknown function (DUF4149)